ncbi:MAG: hypothetical protein ACR2Q4_01955 [Geminicoccaceae bacterium]
MTLTDTLNAYASGTATAREAEEIEALLVRYLDHDLDPDVAAQIKQAIDRDEALADIVDQASAGHRWFREELAPELRPFLDAPASPELRRFVQELTADHSTGTGPTTTFLQRVTGWLPEKRSFALAAILITALITSGLGLYSTIENRVSESQQARANLEQETKQQKAELVLQNARVVALEEKVQLQATALETSRTAEAAAQEQLADAESQITTLQSEDLESKAYVTALQGKLREDAVQEQKLATMRTALDDASGALDRERAAAAASENRIIALESKLIELTSSLVRAETSIEAAEEKLAQSDLVTAILNADVAGFSQQVTDLKRTSSAQAAKLASQQEDLDAAVQRAFDLEAELDGAIQQVVDLRAQRQAMQAALQAQRPASDPSWTVQIAEYHNLYARQMPRHLIEVAADEQEHIEQWLSDQLGRSLTVPDLSEDQLEFKGARLLAINGMPVAQLMYLDDEGEPLAICIMRNMMGKLKDPELSSHSDLNLVDWSDQGYQYAIVGTTTSGKLERLAARLQDS